MFFSAQNEARRLLETTKMKECTTTTRPQGFRKPAKVPRTFSENKKVKEEESAS